ncbi:UNVERIFIED_CONTAM: hypothetical protein HHA_200310 [Hammondia hammondi]|eukprot:XP_008888783.1 hypothetical protein HHA_200310 [Hammondia hammondi]
MNKREGRNERQVERASRRLVVVRLHAPSVISKQNARAFSEISFGAEVHEVSLLTSSFDGHLGYGERTSTFYDLLANMAARISRRLLDAATPLPTAPAGTGAVFHSRLMPVKYALNGPKWMAVVGSAFVGVFSGHFFYKSFILSKNPPNPPRDPNEKPPSRHPHAPPEDD